LYSLTGDPKLPANWPPLCPPPSGVIQQFRLSLTVGTALIKGNTRIVIPMTSLVPREAYSQEELEQLYPKDLKLELVQVVCRRMDAAALIGGLA